MRIQDILDYLKEAGIPHRFEGNADAQVERFSSLTKYQEGTFTWVKKQENLTDDIDLSKISLIFAQDGVLGEFRNVIFSPESKHAFFSTMEHFYEKKKEEASIGQFTYISPEVKLGKNVRIGHNCTLDGEITIGDNTVIWNGVTIINRVRIGKNCDIHSGVVIGHDGFGYTEDEFGNKTMVKHFGGVSIGDGVSIYENICISRGTIDDTIIEDGVKMDALAHVAHNCWFERNVAIVCPCDIAGSVHIKENAYVIGNMIRNQLTIGENSFVGFGAVVIKDVEPNQTVVGVPARPFKRKSNI